VVCVVVIVVINSVVVVVISNNSDCDREVVSDSNILSRLMISSVLIFDVVSGIVEDVSADEDCIVVLVILLEVLVFVLLEHEGISKMSNRDIRIDEIEIRLFILSMSTPLCLICDKYIINYYEEFYK